MEKSLSIIKERRLSERRVILLPDQVNIISEAGFKVFVESGAGRGLDINDEDYQVAGATILPLEKIWDASNFIVKYKGPLPQEYKFLRPGMSLGAIFHAEGDKQLTAALCASGVTAYTYEFFRTSDGVFPLSVVGGEVSGKLAVIYGAYHLQSHLGGRGILLPSVYGAPPAKVLIIGYGNAGGSAARLAVAMGADVVVLGTNAEHLRQFSVTVPSNVKCYLNSPEVLLREIRKADLVIGAILISTFDTPAMVTDDMVKQMKKGAMIIDITCGYGTGYMPSFDKFTDFEFPTYERYGVIHCKIDALPASVPISTVKALSSLIAPYIIKLGSSIYENIEDPTSRAGKIVEKGVIVHPEVQRNIDMQ